MTIGQVLLTVIFILVVYILLTSKTIESLVKKWRPGKEDRDWQARYDREHRHLGKCIEAEKKYLEELDLYRKGEKMLNCGFWSWDMTQDPDEVQYSDNFAEIFEIVKGSKITSKQLMDIVHNDDRQIVNEAILNAFDRRDICYTIEYRIVKKNKRCDLIRCFGKLIYSQEIQYKGEVTKERKPIQIDGSITILQTDVD